MATYKCPGTLGDGLGCKNPCILIVEDEIRPPLSCAFSDKKECTHTGWWTKIEDAPVQPNNSQSTPLFTREQMIDFAKYHSDVEYNSEKFMEPATSFSEWVKK